LADLLPERQITRRSAYEDWRTDDIVRADRWTGREAGGLEILREVKGHKLLMRLRREGITVPILPAMPVSFANNRLSFTDFSSVDHMEVDFKVRNLAVSDCPEAVPVRPVSNIGVGIQLNKFNDGPGGPGNSTGDYIATILAFRTTVNLGPGGVLVTDPEGVLRVRANLTRCLNAPCSTTSFPPVASFDFPETVLVSEPFTLRLVWDEAGHRFLAGVGANPDVALSYPLTLNVKPAAGAPSGILFTGFAANNCAAGLADAKVKVREVRTNTSGIVP